jgi:hypothetical protein
VLLYWRRLAPFPRIEVKGENATLGSGGTSEDDNTNLLYDWVVLGDPASPSILC